MRVKRQLESILKIKADSFAKQDLAIFSAWFIKIKSKKENQKLMFKNMSDYEIVLKYKKGDERTRQKILTYFWNRYQPLVKKIARQRHKTFYQTDMDIEDCIQNCYFCFPKVLDSIKPSRIYSKEDYRFGASLKQYVLAYSKTGLSAATKNYFSTVSTESFKYSDESDYQYIDKHMISKDNVEENVLKKSCEEELKKLFNDFTASCDKDTRRLLKLCVEYNSSANSKSVRHYIYRARFLKKGYNKTYAKTRTITKQFFHQRVLKLKREFIFYMRKHGYYSNTSLKASGLGHIFKTLN